MKSSVLAMSSGELYEKQFVVASCKDDSQWRSTYPRRPSFLVISSSFRFLAFMTFVPFG